MRNFAMLFTALVILGLFAVALGHAQTPAPPAATLTELEKLKIENASLKNTIVGLQKQLIQTQSALLDKSTEQLRGVESEIVADIKKAHPGYTLSQDGTLVAIPSEKK